MTIRWSRLSNPTPAQVKTGEPTLRCCAARVRKQAQKKLGRRIIDFGHCEKCQRRSNLKLTWVKQIAAQRRLATTDDSS
jgi:hypothetical protein